MNFSIPDKGRNISILHRFHTDSGTHQASDPLGNGSYFSENEAAMA
jgi:hypothetical protein